MYLMQCFARVQAMTATEVIAAAHIPLVLVSFGIQCVSDGSLRMPSQVRSMLTFMITWLCTGCYSVTACFAFRAFVRLRRPCACISWRHFVVCDEQFPLSAAIELHHLPWLSCVIGPSHMHWPMSIRHHNAWLAVRALQGHCTACALLLHHVNHGVHLQSTKPGTQTLFSTSMHSLP